MARPAAQDKPPSGGIVSPPAEPEMDVCVNVAVRTSKGPGDLEHPMRLPVSEANALIAMKYAVAGTRRPNAADPEPTVRRFGSAPPPPRPAHSN